MSQGNTGMQQNRAEVLTVKSTNFTSFEKGAYATLFRDESLNRVRKVFRIRRDNAPIENIFAAEIAAFKIAIDQKELCELVPLFYGRCDGTMEILDSSGKEVTDQYRTDLSYEMEFVPGSFIKFGTVPDDKERCRIRNLFWKHGIMYLTDASVVLKERKITKVIDFAVQEHELWHKS